MLHVVTGSDGDGATEIASLAARRIRRKPWRFGAYCLGLCEGQLNKDVAAKLEVCEDTVGKWRRRFITHRLEGLRDEPRPGAPAQYQ